jgi:PKD repeat protein
MIGGYTYLLIETTEPRSGELLGDAHLIQICGSDAKMALSGFASAGMQNLTVVASPPTTYDLSWTEPGKWYATIIDAAPPVGATWYFTLTDRVGNVIMQTLTNDGAPSCPDGDNPDDNYSAASAQSLPTGTMLVLTGTQQIPRVALLNHGFAGNAAQMLMQLGEPVAFVETDFDPVATYARYPVLIVPSGGLFGLSDSPVFRARLEEYARLGGVILAFDQQRGEDYAVLPTPLAPDGGEGPGVRGYGWSQDTSCFINAFYLATSHPILPGFDKPRLSVHADGYFTSWPSDSMILLRRTVNGQPGALVYPFGEGWVFATTMYDDWGVANGQYSDDARILMRDLISWALAEGDLPAYRPGETVSLSIPITNTSSITATTVELALVSPARQLAFTQTLTTEVAPGQSASIPFTTTASLPLGIWNVQPTLLNGQNPIANLQPPTSAFIVHNPPASVAPDNPLSLSVTAPGDVFFKGTDATFTFHVFNHTATSRTDTVRYGLPHHSGESRDYATYGGFDQLSQVVNVAANSEITFTWTVPVFANQDTVWARLESSGARTWFNLRAIAPDVKVQMGYAYPPPYAFGRPLTAVITLTNFTPLTFTPALDFNVRGDTGLSYFTWYSQTVPLTLPAAVAGDPNGSVVTTTVTFTLEKRASRFANQAYDPIRAPFVTGLLRIGPSRIGGAAAPPIYLNDTLFALSAQPVAPWVAGGSGSVSVTLANRHPTLDLSGVLTATLIDPQLVEVFSTVQAVNVSGGQATPIDVPLSIPSSLRQGGYQVRVNATDGYSVLTYTLQAPTYQYALPAAFEQPAYRAEEQARLGAPVRNVGIFQPNLDVQVQAAGLGYSTTQTISLPANGQGTLTLTLTLPADLVAGTHPVSLTYLTPAGETLWMQQRGLFVTAPELQVAVGPSTVEPGGSIAITVTNTGGATANADYDLALYDQENAALQTVAGSLDPIAVDQSQVIAVNVPADARAGQYLLRGVVRETATNQTVDLFAPVDVTGLSAGIALDAERLIYAEGDPVTVVVTVTNTGPAIIDARLDVSAASTARSFEWATFTGATTPLPSDFVNDLAFEGNLLWMTMYFGGGAAVLDDDGTPFEPSDDNWKTFTTADGLASDELTYLAIDGNGLKWFGSWDAGLSVLDDDGTPFDKNDDQWASFDVAQPPDSNLVWRIAIDNSGRKWLATDQGLQVLDDGGTPFNPADDTWQVFAEEDGLSGNGVRGLTIDSAGRKWIGTYFASVSLLNDGGTPFDKEDDAWLTFTPEDGLASDLVYEIVIDSAGRKWFVTEGGVSVLDDNGTPFDKGDDTWQTFTVADGLLSNFIRSIWIDGQGRKWIGTIDGGLNILDDGGTPFDKSDDSWAAYAPAHGLASPNVQAVAGTAGGWAWVGTWEGLNVVYTNEADGVERWRTNQIVDLAASETITLSLPADSLAQNGKYTLQGLLTSSSGQALAASQSAFYIFPGTTGGSLPMRVRGLAALFRQMVSDPPLAVTLEATPALARPGQTIWLTGTLYNFSASTIDPILVIRRDGNDIYDAEPFTLDPGNTYVFSTTAVAPGAGLSVFEAYADDGSNFVAVAEDVPVLNPFILAEVQVPPVVGREPFSLTVVLSNLSRIDAQVDVDTDGAPETIDIPAGETRVVQRNLQIDQNTTYTVTLSGDTDQVFNPYVMFGEAAEVAFDPQPVYPAGHIEIPYTLTNTGQLAVEFTTVVTLSNQQSAISNQPFATFLPVGASTDGLLVFDDVPAGDYTLDYATPYQSGAVNFSVGETDQVALSLTPIVTSDSTLTATAVLTNTGVNVVSATLALAGDFASNAITLTLEPGAALSPSLTLDLAAAEPGVHPITATLYHDDGRILATEMTTVTLSGAGIVISALPATTTLPVGEVVTLTFGLENRGNQAGLAELALAFGDFADEVQTLWLEPGLSGEIAFRLFLPDDLSAGMHVAAYALSASGSPVETGELLLNIDGIDIDVEVAYDASYYLTGETAGLTITVTNQAASAPSLYALARFNNQVFTQSLAFAGSTAVATFDVPARFDGDAKVFYGVYQQDTDRAVHLNTLYLYEYDPTLTLVADRQVYQPGDLVQVSIVATATGQLAVEAPGYTSTLQLPTSNFQFVLPSAMTRGTYEIRYTLTGCGCSLEGQTRAYRFDVDGPQIKITEARVTLQPPTSNLQLTIDSNETLSAVLRAWIVSPEGQSGQVVEQAINLSAAPNNHAGLSVPLGDAGLGPNRLVYQIVAAGNPALVYSTGAETFDVGGAALLGVRTVRAEYPFTGEPVVVEASLFASESTAASLSLRLDGAPAGSQALSLVTGTQTVSLTLSGPIAPAWHDLSATLEVGGITSTQSLRFVYGMQAADLVLSEPRLSVSSSGVTGTLEVFVRNAGGQDAPATVVRIWDGDPDSGGTLVGQIDAQALDAGTGEWLSMTWDFADEGGAHTLYARADALDEVVEFYEDNNTSSAGVSVPGFAVQVSADPATVDPGQVVSITVTAVNLQSSIDVTLALTTTSEYEWSLPVFEDARGLFVNASGQASVTIPWDTTDALGGQYGVRVVAQDDGEQRLALTTVNVRDSANFVAYPLTGTVPLTVTFNDLSTPLGGIDAWLWDFGDSITSTLQNPTHVYSQAGTYTVTLAVTAGTDVYTKTRPGYIVVTPAITADFSGSPLTGTVPLTVTFTNLSDPLEQIESFLWDFGDDFTSTLTNPVHTYAQAGVFTVTLTAIGGSGQDTLIKSEYVTAEPLPGDDFNRADSTDLGEKWTERAGDWHIVSGTLRNASTGDDAIVSYNSAPFDQVAVSVRTQIASGNESTSVGVRWGGYSDGVPTTGYKAELLASGQVILWRIDTWTQLGSYSIANYQPGQWVTLTLRAVRSRLSVDIDGLTRIAVNDATFTQGDIGLWSHDPSAVDAHRFDDVVIDIPGVPTGDDFNRADSTDLGANWTEWTGNWHIASEMLGNASTGDELVASFNGGLYSDVTVTATAQMTGGQGGVALGVRWEEYDPSPTAGYIAELDSDGVVGLWRLDTWQELGSYTIAGYQPGQWVTLTLRAVGSNLSVRVNGVTRITATDGAFTSGEVGLWSYDPTAVNQHRFDNFAVQDETGPTAAFSAAPLTGSAPLTVTFTNQSAPTALITAYLWDFGDGVTSTITNPVHVYTATGSYSVTLTAFADAQQDTLTRANYIAVASVVGDDFNRADSTNLGANWTERAGDWHIVSGTLRNASTSSDHVASFNAGTYADVAVSVTAQIASGGGTVSVGARWDDYDPYPTAGYLAEMSNTGLVRLWRVDTWSQLGSYQIAGYQAGQWVTLTLRADGSSLSVQIDGVTRITATNSAFSSGDVGLWSYAPTSVSAHRFDDFSVQALE